MYDNGNLKFSKSDLNTVNPTKCTMGPHTRQISCLSLNDTAQHYLLFWTSPLLKSNLRVSTNSNTLHTLVAQNARTFSFWSWNSASSLCFETREHSNQATELEKLGLIPSRDRNIFLLQKARLAFVPTLPPIHWVAGVPLPSVNNWVVKPTTHFQVVPLTLTFSWNGK